MWDHLTYVCISMCGRSRGVLARKLFVLSLARGPSEYVELYLLGWVFTAHDMSHGYNPRAAFQPLQLTYPDPSLPSGPEG